MNRRDFLKRGGAAAAALGTGTWAMAEGPSEAKETAMLQVAMLSAWHAHAKGYARTLAGMSDVRIAAVWDEEPERGHAWAQEMDVPFEPDLEAVLSRDDVQGVVVDAPTNLHEKVMVAAAKAGKHIFTEKVMALTIDECDRIAEAVRAANVKFTISFPYRTRPEVLYAKKALEDGLLGDLTGLRVRVAHNGGSAGWLPEHFWDPVPTGGGAMMDLGAHPMYLARYLGGRPTRINSSFTYVTGHAVEDNAVSVIEFENGCLGVSETSFLSTFSPFSLELSGTEGTLVVGGPNEKDVRIRSNKLEGQWKTITELPEPLPNPLRMWVDGVLKDSPIAFGLEEGTQLTELMQYAYLSNREGRKVDIPAR